MSDLTDLYEIARAETRGHSAAAAKLARDLDIDPGSVERCLRRAAADEARLRKQEQEKTRGNGAPTSAGTKEKRS